MNILAVWKVKCRKTKIRERERKRERESGVYLLSKGELNFYSENEKTICALCYKHITIVNDGAT